MLFRWLLFGYSKAKLRIKFTISHWFHNNLEGSYMQVCCIPTIVTAVPKATVKAKGMEIDICIYEWITLHMTLNFIKVRKVFLFIMNSTEALNDYRYRYIDTYVKTRENEIDISFFTLNYSHKRMRISWIHYQNSYY